jgi:hypothetical protein
MRLAWPWSSPECAISAIDDGFDAAQRALTRCNKWRENAGRLAFSRHFSYILRIRSASRALCVSRTAKKTM